MKSPFHRTPRLVDSEFFEFMAILYVTFEENLKLCARLENVRASGQYGDAERAEALNGARWVAVAARATSDAVLRFDPDLILDVWMPHRALDAIARLGYGLGALADPEPEPEALLSGAEIDGLIEQFELSEWIQGMRDEAPAMLSSAR